MISQFLPLIILGLITLPAWWMIWKRSGHSPWISLLSVIPLVNVLVLWVFAFKEWPAEKNKDPF